ncbi:MAG: DoxX family membrane protein [Acidobacteria bacterium]|nr:DoxX family membrane protein [Acidobacteriota bacterium]
MRDRPAPGAYTAALRVLAFMLGLFFVFNAVDKIAWLADSGILAARLAGWREHAAPSTRWYIETIAMPAVPLFARLVPVAELSAGAALILGFWTRLAATVALLMVANFHLARGFVFDPEFLIDGTGFPVLGGLLALAIGGSRLPLSVSRQ